MATTIVINSTNISVDIESTRLTPTTDALERSWRLTGDYDDLLAALPYASPGVSLWGGVVKSATLSRDPQDIGVLDITVSGGGEEQNEDPSDPAGTTPASTQLERTIEVREVQTDLPLCAHRDFPVALIDEWIKFLNSPVWIQNQFSYLTIPSDELSTIASLDAQLTSWATLYIKGLQTYMEYMPVVTARITYSDRPTDVGTNIGKIATPANVWPLSVLNLQRDNQDFAWLMTQDDVSQQADGKWQRITSYTAAYEWSSVLYQSM